MGANQIAGEGNESSVDLCRAAHTNVKDDWGWQCPGSNLVMKICGQMFTTVNSCKTTAKQVKLKALECSRLIYTLEWHSTLVFINRKRCNFHAALYYQVIINLFELWAWHLIYKTRFSCAWYVVSYISNLRSLAVVLAKISAIIQTKMRRKLV